MKTACLLPTHRFALVLRAAAYTAAAFLCGLQAAPADIILALAGTPVATGDGYYAYTYNVQLAAGQLDPVSGGTPLQFATLYDFGPLATTGGALNNPDPSSVYIAKTGLLSDSSGDFTFSFNGTNTPADMLSISDDPTLSDVRLTYIGTNGINVAGAPTTLGPGATTVTNDAANLGTFTIYSPYAATNPDLSYDGQNYRGTNNLQEVNEGRTAGPLVPATVPEPSSWALLGVGGAGLLGLAARRRSRRV